MRILAVIFAIGCLSGCNRPAPYLVRHQVNIPCTNQYIIVQPTRIASDLDIRRAAAAQLPPAALLAYSTDGKIFAPFPVVVYSTFSNTQGIREITVSNTALWISLTTTNPTDVGRIVGLTFTEKSP